MSASRIEIPALTRIIDGTERKWLLGLVRCPDAVTPRQPFAEQVATRHSETIEKDVGGTVYASTEVLPVDGEVLGSVELAVARVAWLRRRSRTWPASAGMKQETVLVCLLMTGAYMFRLSPPEVIHARNCLRPKAGGMICFRALK